LLFWKRGEVAIAAVVDSFCITVQYFVIRSGLIHLKWKRITPYLPVLTVNNKFQTKKLPFMFWTYCRVPVFCWALSWMPNHKWSVCGIFSLTL
jgi:hypothetical protein